MNLRKAVEPHLPAHFTEDDRIEFLARLRLLLAYPDARRARSTQEPPKPAGVGKD